MTVSVSLAMGFRVDALPVSLDNVEVCADSAQTRVSIEERLAFAVARGAGVRVTFRREPQGTRADATLSLSSLPGSVESRTFSQATRGCASIVRAIRAWITIRMDEWAERARAEAAAREAEKPARVVVTPASFRRPLEAEPLTAGLDAPVDVDQQGRVIPEPSGPEISVASSLWGGLSPHTLAGGVVSATFAMNDMFTLRGGLFGYSAPVTEVFAFGHRMDVCRRFPGRYARFHGLALDLCGGAEIGVLARKLFAGVGPSMWIHGDLARGLSLDLGGGVGLPMGDAIAETPRGIAVAYRGDLGLSWRLP